MASRTPKNPALKPPGGTQTGSQNLTRALKELESAFADWESLGTRKAEPEAQAEPVGTSANAANSPAKEFQKKTQTLLDQLRQQLAELAD